MKNDTGDEILEALRKDKPKLCIVGSEVKLNLICPYTEKACGNHCVFFSYTVVKKETEIIVFCGLQRDDEVVRVKL